MKPLIFCQNVTINIQAPTANTTKSGKPRVEWSKLSPRPKDVIDSAFPGKNAPNVCIIISA